MKAIKVTGWVSFWVLAVTLTFYLLVTGDDPVFLHWMVKVFRTTSEAVLPKIVLGMYILAVAGTGLLVVLCCTRKKRGSGGAGGVARMVIAFLVSIAILCLPSEATAGQVTMNVMVTVEKQGGIFALNETTRQFLTAEEQQAIDATVDAVVAGFPNGFTLVGDEYQYQTRVTLLACIAIVIVIVLVIAGGIYVYYKVKEFCKKLGPKVREKQEDEDGTNSTRSVTFVPPRGTRSEMSEFAASFNGGFTRPLTNDLPDCGCGPAPVILRYTLTPSVVPGLISLEPSPPMRPVYEDEYRMRHGLSTNIEELSFSVNGIGTTNPIPQIVLNRGTISLNLGVTNTVTTEMLWSTNQTDWMAIPLSRMSVPLSDARPVHVTFEDRLTGDCDQKKFYRLRVIQ
ncbi:MAG TPA: hypothetical protein VJH94_05595 [Candidatus Paceibacterota bacterium]